MLLDSAWVPQALLLSQEAGWNQVADDWKIFFTYGWVLGFVAGGRLIATSAALPYGPAIGWVSMVLVTAEWRRRGLGTRLIADCTAALRDSGRAALLDAVPAAASIYAGLGFAPLCPMERWEGLGSELEATSAVANFSLDGPAFGADRHFLLENFLSSGQCSLRLVSRVYDPTERFRGIAHRPARFQPSRGSRTSAECDTRCLGKSLHRCTRPQYAGSDTHRTWLSQAARLRSHGLRAYRTPGIRRTAGGSGSGVRLSSSDRRLARLQTSLQRPGIHYTVDSRDYVLGPVEFISNRRNVILNSPRTGVPKHTAI